MGPLMGMWAPQEGQSQGASCLDLPEQSAPLALVREAGAPAPSLPL